MNKQLIYVAAFMLLLSRSSNAQHLEGSPLSKITPPAKLVIPLQAGEKIWSGIIKDGENLPYAVGSHYDFYANNRDNQIQPLLLGNHGLWVWSEEPYAFEVAADKVIITKVRGEVKSGRAGNTLAEARQYVSGKFFPPSGRMPDELLFAKPQYNTWIELNLYQNQNDVLKYAHAIVDNGFSPGVLMIDDTWQEDYGVWNFHPGKFPNPKQMMDELHQMGFKVMLWICPFVSPDQSQLVHQLLKDKCFMMQKTKEKTTWEAVTDPAIIKWWNGYSAVLDLSNPAAVRWYGDQMDRLVKDYGVDGFKLDAGDMNFYPADALSKGSVSPNQQCELHAQFGLRFPLNEYRACWKMAGQPLGQRLHDKNHNWEDVQKLIPQMLTEGLAGYTFSCPDMIGGGMLGSFSDPNAMNQDLVVRSAQIHALMPMMQFSAAPWRILDEEHLNAVKKAVKIREQFTPTILELARQSAKTGEPIVRSLEYVFPNQGYEQVKDEFMLGDSILVAPLDKQVTSRQIVLPKGEWIGDDGKASNGGATFTLEVPIDRIPYFHLKK
ncbi:MAG: glycoside hydrolase family 31 protein [Verrucomicrobiota bacterium]